MQILLVVSYEQLRKTKLENARWAHQGLFLIDVVSTKDEWQQSLAQPPVQNLALEPMVTAVISNSGVSERSTQSRYINKSTTLFQ